MKIILELILAFIPGCFEPLINMVKREILKIYVRGVDQIRLVFVSGLLAVFWVMLAFSGFVMIHIALFFLLPWSPQTNALILLFTGAIYFLIATLSIAKISSRRTWMKMSGAEKMARDLE
jgi:hypothetical protein